MVAAEAEYDGRKAQRLGQVRERRHPDSPTDEQRPLDVEAEAVSERAEDGDRIARFERAQRFRSGPDRVDEERELARRREAERERPRQQAARRLEHEELSWTARLERGFADRVAVGTRVAAFR